MPTKLPLRRARETLGIAGYSLRLRPRSRRLEGGLLAQAFPPPRLCRRVLGSRAQGRTFGVSKPVCSWYVEPVARTTSKGCRSGPEGIPLQLRKILAGGLRKPIPSSGVSRRLSQRKGAL